MTSIFIFSLLHPFPPSYFLLSFFYIFLVPDVFIIFFQHFSHCPFFFLRYYSHCFNSHLSFSIPFSFVFSLFFSLHFLRYILFCSPLYPFSSLCFHLFLFPHSSSFLIRLFLPFSLPSFFFYWVIYSFLPNFPGFSNHCSYSFIFFSQLLYSSSYLNFRVLPSVPPYSPFPWRYSTPDTHGYVSLVYSFECVPNSQISQRSRRLSETALTI